MAQNSVTSVTLSSNFLGALTGLGVQASGFGSTEIRGGIADFQITGGAVDLDSTRLEIAHNGGLTFQAGQTAVNLTDFVISNLGDRTVLTGLVTVNGDLVARLPLFGLGEGEVVASAVDDVTNLNLTNADVALTSEAAQALNQVFGVSAFLPMFNVGTAQVDAFVETATGDVLEGFAPPETAQMGTTSVTLSQDLLSALTTLGVEASGFGDTEINNGVAEFKITGGEADLMDTQVEIIHSGGLVLKTGATEVTLTDFIISNLGDQTVLTGLVSVNDNLVSRLPLFGLEIGAVATSEAGDITNLDLSGVEARLTPVAAQALNQAFRVEAFLPELSVGTAQVEAFVETTGDVLGLTAPSMHEDALASITAVDAPILPMMAATPTTPTTMAATSATFDVVQSGDTSVTFSGDFLQALGSLGVQASGFGSTEIRGGVADFLITGGAADLADTQVEIIHSGGLTLTSGQRTVNLTDFIISNVDGNASLSGLLTVDGDLLTRASLFDLNVSRIKTSAQGNAINLDLKDVSVGLTGGAAEVLNQAFGVTAFTPGFNIGAAQVDALVG